MVSTLLTFFSAIVIVFLLVLGWVVVDRLANRELGERNRCCHSLDTDNPSRGCCGKHASCELKDEPGAKPAYTLHNR